MPLEEVTTEPVEKESVGWRLPKFWMDKSREEAKRLDLTITGFVIMLMINYFTNKRY